MILKSGKECLPSLSHRGRKEIIDDLRRGSHKTKREWEKEIAQGGGKSLSSWRWSLGGKSEELAKKVRGELCMEPPPTGKRT